ncbi:MAG: hypothetical protein ACPG8W_05265, partial [Candidatus Promineifilaceae bacterium]
MSRKLLTTITLFIVFLITYPLTPTLAQTNSIDTGYVLPSRVLITNTIFDCNNVTEIPQIECEALVAFYSSTGGDNWTDSTGWMQTNTPCSWYGVDCSEGRIVHISRLSNNLTGAIPAEIGDLSALKELILSGN